MKARAKIYLILILASMSYRAYEGDMEGLTLSLLLIPMCFLMMEADD